jgi:hypothetical protein
VKKYDDSDTGPRRSDKKLFDIEKRSSLLRHGIKFASKNVVTLWLSRETRDTQLVAKILIPNIN